MAGAAVAACGFSSSLLSCAAAAAAGAAIGAAVAIMAVAATAAAVVTAAVAVTLAEPGHTIERKEGGTCVPPSFEKIRGFKKSSCILYANVVI